MARLQSHKASAALFKALGDQNRLRIVELLFEHGPMTGTQIATDSGMSIALLSHHWKILRQADVVSTTKRGQATWCTLNRERLIQAVAWLIPEKP
jgi:DNA-binding transcriptional ArsR family regulator